MAPWELLEALADRSMELRDVETISMHTDGPAPHVSGRVHGHVSPTAGIVTTRGHVQYVATEYGIVNLSGQSVRRRAELMISIAHPDFRVDLRAQAVERRLFGP